MLVYQRGSPTIVPSEFHGSQVDNASWNGECVTYWKRCSALEGYEVTERLLSEQVGNIRAAGGRGMCRDSSYWMCMKKGGYT